MVLNTPWTPARCGWRQRPCRPGSVRPRHPTARWHDEWMSVRTGREPAGSPDRRRTALKNTSPPEFLLRFVASSRFVPVIVTTSPADPHVGVNEVMVGAQPPAPVVAGRQERPTGGVGSARRASARRCSWYRRPTRRHRRPRSRCPRWRTSLRRPSTSSRGACSGLHERQGARAVREVLKPVPVMTTTQSVRATGRSDRRDGRGRERRGLEAEHHQGHPDPDSRYASADVPFTQTHSIFLSFRIDIFPTLLPTEKTQLSTFSPLPHSPPSPGRPAQSRRGGKWAKLYTPPPCASNFPGPPRQALSSSSTSTRKAATSYARRNLPLLITTAGEKGCAALELSLPKKRQPDLIERGPVPQNRRSSWKVPTDGTSLATIGPGRDVTCRSFGVSRVACSRVRPRADSVL